MNRPSHTLTCKSDSLEVWSVDRRTNSKAAGGGTVPTVTVPMDRPSPTLTGKGGLQWIFNAPATTVCADPRLSFRGHHDPEHRSLSQEDGAVKLTIEEGLILQSFRPDYPVQGTRTKQWEQIGNAIPPLLAAAVLGELLA